MSGSTARGHTYIDNDGSVKFDAAKIVNYPDPPGFLEPRGSLRVTRGGRIVPIPTKRVGRIVNYYVKLVGVEDCGLGHPHRLRHWTEDAYKPVEEREMELSDIMHHSKSRFGTTGIYDRKISDQRRREVLLQATNPLFN